MDDKSGLILDDIGKVDPLSASAASLLKVASQEEHDLADLVEIVKGDATLTAKVLKVVNSAAYGLPQEVTAIDRAISFTGEDALVSLAMNEAAAMIYESDLLGYGGQQGEMWEHNLLTALGAKMVAGQAKAPLSGEVAFTCGLLHDFGKAILSSFLENTAAKVVKALDDGKVQDYATAEEKILGMDHCRAGYELALHWNLPEPLPSAMRYHHQPHLAPEELRPLVYAVHLGDMLAMMGGKGTGADAMRYSLDKRYEDYFDLDEGDLARIILDIDTEFSKMQESLEAEAAA